MLHKLRQRWQEFKDSPPGRRFQCIHKRRAKRHPEGAGWRRWGLLALGIFLLLAGIFFLAVPGPGTLVLAVGLALIAQESLTVARLLDWLEVKLRPLYLWGKRRWQHAGTATRWTVMGILGAMALAAAGTAYLLLIH